MDFRDRGGTGKDIDTSDVGNPYLFQGRRWDGAMGLYYYRNRYYSPRSGRFISQDPMGVWYDAFHNGNPYAGLNNNPVSFVDPYGTNSHTTAGFTVEGESPIVDVENRPYNTYGHFPRMDFKLDVKFECDMGVPVLKSIGDLETTLESGPLITGLGFYGAGAGYRYEGEYTGFDRIKRPDEGDCTVRTYGFDFDIDRVYGISILGSSEDVKRYLVGGTKIWVQVKCCPCGIEIAEVDRPPGTLNARIVAGEPDNIIEKAWDGIKDFFR